MNHTAQLERLLRHPSIVAVLNEAEAETLAQRRELIEELREIDAEHASELTTASSEVQELDHKISAMVRDLHAVRDAFSAANNKLHRLIRKHGIRRAELLNAIERFADARLIGFHSWLITAESAVRMAAIDRVVAVVEGDPTQESKHKERFAREARKVIADAMERVETLRHEDIARDDVSAWLTSTEASIRSAAEKIGANLPAFRVA